jgi:tetratricopeptide (TPR) repeat protein
LFQLAEPGKTNGQAITARELLDRGTSRVSSELAGDPAMQVALFNVIGRVYGNLSLHDAAIDVLRRALDLGGAKAGTGSLAQADTLHQLGELQVRKNDYRAAETSLREALSLRRQLAAPAADIAASLEALGRALGFAGKYNDALPLLQEAAAIRRREPVSPGPLMASLNELATATHRLGDMKSAEALFREAAEVGRQLQTPSPERVNALLNLARMVHLFDRDPERAEPIFREALAAARAIYEGDHQDTAGILGEMARDVRDLGRLDDAEKLAREAVAMLTRLYGTRNRETMISSQTLASILREQGRVDEAELLLREAVHTARALVGASHPSTLGAQRALASLLEERRKFAEARTLRETELASALKDKGENDVYVALALDGLGRHALGTNAPLQAERYFLRALSIREAIHPADHWRVFEARGYVGLARLVAGRLQEAEADLLAAHEGLRRSRGPAAAETLTARRHLADLYERWGRDEDARRYRAEPR